MSWRACASPWRRASYRYNLSGVLLAIVIALVERL
jgi:hypothetical protein